MYLRHTLNAALEERDVETLRVIADGIEATNESEEDAEVKDDLDRMLDDLVSITSQSIRGVDWPTIRTLLSIEQIERRMTEGAEKFCRPVQMRMLGEHIWRLVNEGKAKELEGLVVAARQAHKRFVSDSSGQLMAWGVLRFLQKNLRRPRRAELRKFLKGTPELADWCQNNEGAAWNALCDRYSGLLARSR